MHPRALILLVPIREVPGAALLALVERLQENAIPYVVVSLHRGRCVGTGGVHITATRLPGEVQAAGSGGLVVLDGQDGRLAEDRAVIELVRAADRARIPVCAIGCGTLALAAAGVLGACAVAADARTAERLRAAHAAPLVEPLVACGHIVTASEAGAAALGDILHDLRGPSALAPEPPV